MSEDYKDTFVISLGGSIVVPNEIDTDFLTEFKRHIDSYLSKNKEARIIFVVGGGAAARNYQNAAKKLNSNPSDYDLDMIGIRATHLNAEYVRLSLGATSPLCTAPKAKNIPFEGQILVAGGWKPGFSTDTDAVYLAIKFGAKNVLNLSNTDLVYTSDPRVNKDAKPIHDITWKDFQKIVGTKWTPGKNVPFDPVASKLAKKNDINVICANGRNIKNTISILKKDKFVGTFIHN